VVQEQGFKCEQDAKCHIYQGFERFIWRKRQESNPTSHFDSSSTALKAARPTGDDALPGTMIPNPVAMAMGKCTRMGFYLAGMVIFWQLAG